MAVIQQREIAGRRLNPIGFGCMNMSWGYAAPPSQADCEYLLHRALDLGYDHLDTARIYGAGHNEALIGEVLKNRRHQFTLASKCGIVVDGAKRGVDCSPAKITAEIDQSLSLLQTEYIDLYYMHRFDPTVPIAESVGAMVRAIEAGKIGGYGVSEWSAAHIAEAHAIHPVTAVQTEYSLWTRNVELGVLDICRQLGIAFVAFSPLGRGALCNVLTDPTTLEDTDLRTKMPRFNARNWPKNLALVERFAALARDAGVTPAQLALRWVLARGDHIHVIPGTTNPQHLTDNVHAGSVAVAEAAIEQAGQIINHAAVSGHRYQPSLLASIDTEDFLTSEGA